MDANLAIQKAIRQIEAEAKRHVAIEIKPALEEVAVSQDGLESQLKLLDGEMSAITTVLEKVTLDPETSARMEATKEVMKRTKRKLTTIRGRLGRLRMYEESDRLHLTERQLVERNSSTKSKTTKHISTDELWTASASEQEPQSGNEQPPIREDNNDTESRSDIFKPLEGE